MHTKIKSAGYAGIAAHSIEIEVDLSLGLLQFFIVGLADLAIKESRQRVTSALKNCGVRLPDRKITINLAPAHVKKEGSLYDLAIALGILIASQKLNIDATWLDETIVIGELALDGRVKPVVGVLPIACDAPILGIKRIVVPQDNAQEASLAQQIEVIAVSHLQDLIIAFSSSGSLEHANQKKAAILRPYVAQPYKNLSSSLDLDFHQVRGQRQAKRILQIAAAGWHNVIFIGSPGSGKTMLAQRLSTLLPDMTFEQMVETTKIYSICRALPPEQLITQRPFRAPHHSISGPGLVGGGATPQPGEVSLAHNGVLFVDEFAEFSRTCLEALRQPLEQKEVTIARAQQTSTFPASFLLIAALNPCPCGYFGDSRKKCMCSSQHIQQYLAKISGPLLDRIDLQAYLPSVTPEEALSSDLTQSSAELRTPIVHAWQRQQERYGNKELVNGTASLQDIPKIIKTVDGRAQQRIAKAFDQLALSMRGYHKLLRIVRTIADLDNRDSIELEHVQEALMYRCLDKSLSL